MESLVFINFYKKWFSIHSFKKTNYNLDNNNMMIELQVFVVFKINKISQNFIAFKTTVI